MSPLPYSLYQPVPLSHVRPAGWILEFLKRQCAGITGHPQASADEGVAWIRELGRDLAIPGLSRWGIRPADIPALVEQAARASSMKANPVVLTADELSDVLARAG